MEKRNERRKTTTYDMICISLFAVLMAVCSWISVPTVVPFTMQTFGLFFTLCVLGGKRGTMVILIYILLGTVGLPVFSGFQSGAGVIMGTTGGYIIGFVLSCLLYWLAERLWGDRTVVQIGAMIAGMIAYYGFGTAWFIFVYLRTAGDVTMAAVLGWCVIPFIIPDLLKMALAVVAGKRVKKMVKKI
ncbi:MAG: biotin transporter BioY [Emergencia sp.]|nr:biotin transporter BioY [Emergencia sp.]